VVDAVNAVTSEAPARCDGRYCCWFEHGEEGAVPAESIKVNPAKMVQAAATVAATAEQVATPNPAAVPAPAAGSPMDAAWSALAATMGTEVSQMAAAVATKGPAVQGVTSSGAAQMETMDEDNAELMREVPDAGGSDGAAGAISV
jgi:hypothetical protein